MSVAGSRIELCLPSLDDGDEFLAAAKKSRPLHRGLVQPPKDAAAFATYLERGTRPDFRGYFARRKEDGVLVGVFNVSQIVLGGFRSAYLGYYAFLPHAGQGYMTEGLRLLLREVFLRLGLHRIEANLQPKNDASRALVKRCGFVLEGYSKRYLKISGAWRDHERWALVVEDWRKTR